MSVFNLTYIFLNHVASTNELSNSFIFFVMVFFISSIFFIISTLDMVCLAHRNFTCFSVRLEILMKEYN